jgi:nucleotide-binding universal stress UspA family protein
VYGTIVVGVDGSHDADLAVDAAVGLAKTVGDAVIVVHAVTIADPSPGASPLVIEDPETAEAVLAGPLAKFKDAGVSASGQVHHASSSHIGELLNEVARTSGAGLIVVGNRGHGEMHSALFGSTAHQTIHHASVPVMVVRDRAAG